MSSEAVSKVPVHIILGVAGVGDSAKDMFAKFDTPEQVNSYLDPFYQRGYREIDTARLYSPNAPGTSEVRLGAVKAAERFVVDTKVWSGTAGDHKADRIAQSVSESLEALQTSQVNIEYLHMPDRATPFEETLQAIDKEYRAGKFRKFGLSNYTTAEVKEIVDICTKRGYVKPTVYQGQYNAVMRGVETELFPVLREHGIAFNAYSPAAGGFFSENTKGAAGTRFDTSTYLGQMYSSFYRKPAIEAAAEKARALGKKLNISGHAAALRWVIFHSILWKNYGDGVIIGASSVKQLEQNLDAIDAGPLPEELAACISSVYDSIDEEDKKMFSM